MSRRFYDLHIHSCLSPCADDDMTPADIAGMAKLNGLDIAALTDHNTCKNCPAFFAACREYGVTPVAGMELTTAEDIHLMCLFPSLETAMAFDNELQSYRVLIPNRTDIFGRQLIYGENGDITGEEPNLLSNATTLTIEKAHALAFSRGAAAYPAHADREANGIIAVLGTFPEKPAFTACELRDRANLAPYAEKYPALRELPAVFCSDAHYLYDISEAQNSLEVADGDIAANLVKILRSGK